MARIRSTITGAGAGNAAADKRVHRRELCAGTVADGEHVYVPSNSRPLSSFVESASLRSTTRYDWATGEMRRESLDVLENARRNINSLRVRPVTNARSCVDPEGCDGGAMAMPMMGISGGRKRKGKR